MAWGSEWVVGDRGVGGVARWVRSNVAACVAGVLLVAAVASPAAADATTERFASAAAVRHIFPRVQSFGADGYDGDPAGFPSCAGVDYDAGPGAVRTREGSYDVSGPSRTVTWPGASLYRYSSVRKAKRTLRMLDALVTRCHGKRKSVDERSTFRRVPAPRLGDARLAFESRWWVTFEGPWPKCREIWVRHGRWLMVAETCRYKGELPAAKTRSLARLVYRHAF